MPLIFAVCAALAGCADRHTCLPPQPTRELLIAVTPVINLSGDERLDALRVTDLVASEFLAFPRVQVVPVNLTLAALARRGHGRIETPEEALELGAELGADAVVVVAVTEWDPFDPPALGVVMQWYAPHELSRGSIDPLTVSRQASDVTLGQPPAPEAVGRPRPVADGEVARPTVQVQRVFNAALDEVQKDVRRYADNREGANSPYEWRRYLKSSELFTRYCCWATIRTILEQVGHGAAERCASEAEA